MNDKEFFRFPIVNVAARFVFGFSIISVLVFGSTANAQKFDLEAYLKKIDVNRNGKLEENEMSDRTKGWIGKMGLDTNKTVSISKVLAKVAKDKRDAERGNSVKTKTSARKVPGFGTAAAETTGVSRFDSSGSSSSKSPVKYSDSVMERVASTLERYDRNKDGVLDKSEIKEARWGSPSPTESDKNRDGKLSRSELAGRYGDREKYYRNSSTSASSSRSASKKAEEDRARRERDRERFRSSGASSSSRPSSSRSSSSSSGSSSKISSADSQAKYKKYAESLISNYDKDQDGKLNREEIEKMRRPPVGADTNKDGFITQSELLNSLSGANKTSTVVVKTASKSSSKPSKFERRGPSTSRTSSSRSGTSSSFDKLDSNADRHVQMHEFSSDWDEEKIAEFYDRDKNGDGVITIQEWAGRQ